MKIIISSEGNTPESKINSRFSRAPWFMVYDSDTQTWEAFDNSSGVNTAQGAGIQAAQTVSDLNVKVVISGMMGPKAYRALDAAHVDVYLSSSGTVQNVLDDFNAGKLKKASAKDAAGI